MLGVGITRYGPQPGEAVQEWADEMGVTFPLALDDAGSPAYLAYTSGIPGDVTAVTFVAVLGADLTAYHLGWAYDAAPTIAAVEAALAGR